jgi:hypothetical protein
MSVVRLALLRVGQHIVGIANLLKLRAMGEEKREREREGKGERVKFFFKAQETSPESKQGESF